MFAVEDLDVGQPLEQRVGFRFCTEAREGSGAAANKGEVEAGGLLRCQGDPRIEEAKAIGGEVAVETIVG